MNKRWIVYQLGFLILLSIYNYVFNFSAIIPEGKLLSYTLFFILDQGLLIGYFYLNLFLAKFTIKRIGFFIPLQLLILLLSCLLLSGFPYLHAIYEGYTPNVTHIYLYKLFGVFIHTFLSIGFRFLQNWEQSNIQKQELIKTNHQAELNFLRSQISPHFLLNTLNSVYALSLKKSDETYPAISELKNLFSYVKQHEQKVSLQEEIEYLKNFINLQQRRFGKELDLQTEFQVDNEYFIEPLLLSTFVENAFKHGISMKEKSFIHIRLHVNNGILWYHVDNSFHIRQSRDAISGIGLANLSRRLELLYPDNYELRFFQEENTYVSTLKIRLV